MAFTADSIGKKNPDFSDLNLENSGDFEDGKEGVKQTGNAMAPEQSGLDFLEPKKDINKEARSDPYRIMVTEKEAYQMTMKAMNALTVVSPIISGLLQNLEANADGKQLSDDFNKIITEVSTVAESTCAKIGIDPTKANNRWVRNMLERIYSNIAHDQWINKKEVNLENVFYLIEKVVDYSVNSAEKMQYIDLDEQSSVALSCINAMAPVIEEMENASLFRNIEEDIEPIMKKLFDASEKALKKLANDYAGPENRAKLFALLMQEAGKLYASSWKNEVKRINYFVSKNPTEAVKEQIEKYKTSGGMPLVKIDANFDRFFERTVVISAKLIEDRRKKK